MIQHVYIVVGQNFDLVFKAVQIFLQAEANTQIR